MVVKGITIHNTGNDKPAKEIYEELVKNGTLNLCHFLIDENDIVECCPVDMEASHTGKGYDYGNRFTLAIEICRSQCDETLYLKAQDNAVKFIKKLMKKYRLKRKNIYFHNDFNNIKCPHRIIEIYGSKERFLDECKL